MAHLRSSIATDGGGDGAADFRGTGAAALARLRCWRDRPRPRRAAATPAASRPGSPPSRRRPRRRACRGRRSAAALDGVTFDPAIIRRDSGQGVFQQSFLQFAGRMTAAGRYQNGLKQAEANAALSVAHRTAVRRAAAGGRGAVGAGKRLRRLQGRHLSDHPVGRDAGLRLPALGVLPRSADGRGADRRARRSAAGRDDRQLGGRTRADAVHAVRTISSTASISTATAAST